MGLDTTAGSEQFSAPAVLAYGTSESKALGYDVWRILATFRFYPDLNDVSTYVEVPEGFLSDGASVPPPFWNLLPPQGAYGQAAIIHDYLCETGKMIVSGVPAPTPTRAKVDSLFKQAMVASKVPGWKRNIMYIAVRIYSKLTRPPVPNPDLALDKLVAEWNPAYTPGVSGSAV
jgi:hypothetical protein